MRYFKDFQVPSKLKKHKVSRIAKEGSTILIQINSGRKSVRFDIAPTWQKTISNFESQSKEVITDRKLKQAIIFYLSKQWLNLIVPSGNGGTTAATSEQKEQRQQITTEQPEELSVSEALRRKKRCVRVKGQVIGHSSVYDMIVEVKLRCSNCGFDKAIDYSKKPVFRSPVRELSKCPTKLCGEQGLTLRADPEYITAIDVELQDPEKFSEIERIRVKLFEGNTQDVLVGKIVVITGNIHVVRENDNPSNKPTPVIYAESIEDVKKEHVKLTEKDVKEILDWKKSIEKQRLNVVDELASHYAPRVIGYEHVKKGLLMVCANAGITNNEKRTPRRLRINALLIGDPSLAKSLLLHKVADIIPNARYESCQSSTGLSLTAQVSKEEDHIYTLRHGPIPLASGSVCALNEIGQMPISDHKHFLDCMQEGKFTLNKHGFNASIAANTSIVASANPINNTWKDPKEIQQSEFPTLTQIIHRFDFIFIFIENTEPEYLREYTRRRDEIAKKSGEGAFDNYDSFLRKYLMYARTFEPIFSEEARAMLNDYLVNIADAGVRGLPRKLESLESAAIALAKLKLKNVVEAEDVTEIMEFYNVILIHFRQSVPISKNPRDVAYEECVEVLKSSRFAMSYEEIVKSVCSMNDKVKRYIGENKYKLEHNIKLRPILELLQNHNHLVQTSQKPIAFQWTDTERNACSNNLLSDASDVSDALSRDPNEKKLQGSKLNDDKKLEEENNSTSENNFRGLAATTSDASDTSDSNASKPIVSVEEFFHDGPDLSWQPLPDHTLEQSPCSHIIVKKGKFYHCKLHLKELRNIHLSTIEQHCKYQDPDLHKAEILRLSSIN